MSKSEKLSRAAVLSAAKKRLPVKGTKSLNEILAFAADDMAEAYRIGAEEAQQEIVRRLNGLKSSAV